MKLSLVYMLCCVKYIQTQFPPVYRRTKSPCDASNRSALVERFFNMIFTEFHNTPPICVCVQMCEGQSTYCYPNGCLKRDKKREAVQPVSLIENSLSSMFLVEQKNEGTRDLYSIGYDNTGGLDMKTEAITEKQRNIRPDPFKDKYKSLFKYKKTPKVELRYNLREQVKNTKSDVLKSGSVDISNTRWPQTKRNKLNGHIKLPDLKETHPSSAKHNTFFISSLPEKDLVVYPLRYFKRDLTNAGDKLNISSNLSKEVSNSTFSLETFIDNLIENNLITNNSVTNQTNLHESNDIIFRETTTERFNETNIVLINSTDENLDNSKYTESINYTNIFNELIAKLSKKIDKRNNTSMEIMRKFTNNVVIGYDLSNEVDENDDNKVETTTFESTSEGTNSVATTTKPTFLKSLTDSLNTTEQAEMSNTISNDCNEVKTITKIPEKVARQKTN